MYKYDVKCKLILDIYKIIYYTHVKITIIRHICDFHSAKLLIQLLNYI